MTVYIENEKRIGKKAIRKIKEVGTKNMMIGCIKKMKYMQMIRKYHFDAWHLSPYEWKEYAQVCARYVNAHSCKAVVDIGCGLGEILQHVKADKKIGLDLEEAVIAAARELNSGEIDFEVGSFAHLTESPVDYLITLNFMHGGKESEWAESYRVAAVRNKVQHFIVDIVPEGVFGKCTHSLDWSKILPDNYRRIERFGPLLSGRYVEVWEIESNNL